MPVSLKVFGRGQRLSVLSAAWGCVDSDWAADLDSRRSHTGYILMLSGGAVSWKSRRRNCVSLSTSEVEYVAASQCGQEVVYLREILRNFVITPTGPTRIYDDNLACVAMSEKPVRRKYSRHIDIRRYFAGSPALPIPHQFTNQPSRLACQAPCCFGCTPRLMLNPVGLLDRYEVVPVTCQWFVVPPKLVI